ncbi:MAG: exosortase/archaeosortase family protein [Planctomycetaceae bacterium]|nr:exosortase/archaeosortase family protein [Planctomycetaceae bacterium]
MLQAGLVCGLAWLYWPGLKAMQIRWESDPQYSHGYLVPLFSLILLIARRDSFHPELWRSSWRGLLLLGTGLGLKLYASHYYIEAISQASLVISVAGAVAVVWGWRGLKWALPAVLFLVFMLPLPHSLEGAMHGPLRTVGTKISTFFMQTVGLPAYSEGHVIIVGEQAIGVAEACSGLRMLMVFFALSTAVGWLITDSWWFRLVLVFSAVPIALVANMVRIASTGTMFVYLSGSQVFGMPGEQFATKFFHDWAGWFMMPIGLLLLWIEIGILDRLVIKVDDRPVGTGIPPVS